MSSPNPPSDGSDSAGSGNSGPNDPSAANTFSDGSTFHSANASGQHSDGIPVGQPDSVASDAVPVIPGVAPSPPAPSPPAPSPPAPSLPAQSPPSSSPPAARSGSVSPASPLSQQIPTAPAATGGSATFWVLLGIGVFSMFLLLMCSGVVTIIYFASKNLTEERLSKVLGTESDQEFILPEGDGDFFSSESYHDAIENSPRELPPVREALLESFITELMQQEQSDYAALRRFISPAGYVRQMARAFPDRRVTVRDRRSVVAGFDRICYGPELYYNHEILAVQSVAADEYAVTMRVWNYPGAGEIVRWWVYWRSDAEAWELCDWKSADEPMSDAGEYAVIFHETSDSYRNNYYSLTDRLYGDDYQEREQAMLDFSRTPVSPYLQPMLAYRIAGLWLDRGQADQAELLLPKLRRPRFAAARLRLQTRIAQQRENWNDVITYGQDYLEFVGFNPWTSKEIADAYVAKGDWDSAQKIWLSLSDQVPLSTVVVRELNQHLEQCSDEYLKQFAAKYSADTLVLLSVDSGYGLDVLPLVKRWRELELPLQKSTQRFLDAKQYLAVWDYENALPMFQELVKAEEAKTIEVPNDGYATKEARSLASMAQSELDSLDYLMLTNVERYEKSEDKLEYFYDWYWYDYMDEGDFEQLPAMVEVLERDFSDAWETKVAKARLLENKFRWVDLTTYLNEIGLPDDADGKNWKAELEELQLESAIQSGESIEQLMRYSDRPRFYRVCISRLADKEDWKRLEALVDRYRALPRNASDDSELTSSILRAQALVSVSKEQHDDAFRFFKKALQQSSVYSNYLLRSDIEKWLSTTPDQSSEYWKSLLAADRDGHLLRSYVQGFIRKNDVEGLEDFMLSGAARKIRKELEFVVAYLNNDIPTLTSKLKSLEENRAISGTADIYQTIGYDLEVKFAAKIFQAGLESGDEQQLGLAKKLLNNSRVDLGDLVFAIEDGDWEQAEGMRFSYRTYTMETMPELQWWREGEAYQNYVQRYGRSVESSGQWSKLLYNRVLSDQEMLDKLQALDSQWKLRPEVGERLSDINIGPSLRIWQNDRNPNFVLLLAEIPKDEDFSLDQDWQKQAGSVLFLVCRSEPSEEVQTEMLNTLLKISSEATAIIHDWAVLVNQDQSTGLQLGSGDWKRGSKSYFQSFPESIFSDDSEQTPNWKNMRDKYRKFSNASLSAGASVSVELSFRELIERVPASIVEIKQEIGTPEVLVRLEGNSVLGDYSNGDRLRVEWHQIILD